MIRRERRSLGFIVGVILVTLFAVLCIVPLVYMILVSFADTTTMYIRWEDIKLFDFFNYRYLFENRNFGRPILNSLIVVVISVIAVDLLSCSMAYGFAKKPIPGKKGLFNLVLATMMIPTQVVFISLYVMMRQWHLLNTYIALVIPLIGAFGVFMMRQFIQGVANDFVEAAQIDGQAGPHHPGHLYLQLRVERAAVAAHCRDQKRDADPHRGDQLPYQLFCHQLWSSHGCGHPFLPGAVHPLLPHAEAVCGGHCPGRRQGMSIPLPVPLNAEHAPWPCKIRHCPVGAAQRPGYQGDIKHALRFR